MKTIAQKKCRVCVISALCVMLGAALLGSLGSLSVAARAQETPNDALPPAIDADTARLELLVAALRGGQVTVEAARQGGDLSVDDVLEILATRLNDWGGFEWGKDEAGLRRALAKVLAEHGGERLKKEDLGKLPPKVRLWLADYFQSIKDARTVEMAESILSEIKAPVQEKEAKDFSFQTIERLAWYYRDAGQYQKAAQTWLRMEGLHEKTGWWVPDSLVEAARLYWQTGEAKKAEEIAIQVQKYDDIYLAGLALYAHADFLIGQGKLEDARRFLQKVLAEERTEEVGVALLQQMGRSFYKAGDFETAKKYYEQVIERYNALPLSTSLKVSNLSGTAASLAEFGLKYIEQWKEAPLYCEPDELYIVVQQDKPKKPQAQRFLIHSFRPVLLTIASDTTKIKVQLEGDWKKDDFGVVKEVIVKIAAEALGESFDATLIVRSTEHPKFEAHVAVEIDVRDDE